MFEGSLVESRGLVASGTQRWTVLGSLTLQCAVAGLLMAIPLLRPQPLPVRVETPRLELPLPMKPPMVEAQPRAAAASSEIATPAAARQTVAKQLFVFPRPGSGTDGAAPLVALNLGMGPGGPGAPGDLRAIGVADGPSVSVIRPRTIGPVNVSRGVTEGMLLAPIQPVYPAIARAAGVQGTVVMEAVIAKTGRIESLHAISGPEMLRGAALTAVQAARYRPYLLNGEPVEVQTTVTVVFTLGN